MECRSEHAVREVEVRDDAVLKFPDGLIGLPGTRYALLAQRRRPRPSSGSTRSTTDDVAVPVTNPWLFFADYEVRVSDEDAAKLELDAARQADILCVVRAAEQLEDFTVNLAGPSCSTRAPARPADHQRRAGTLSAQPLFAEVELGDVQRPPARRPSGAQAGEERRCW